MYRVLQSFGQNMLFRSWLLRIISGISLFCVNWSGIHAQASYVIIGTIDIRGLKKTDLFVAMLELDIRKGDTLQLSELADRMRMNEQRLESISIFSEADINVKNWNTETSRCDLEINVRENWFIYPYLIFELADRNFDVWRKEMNYALDRVNYGIALNHINLTGRKDKFKLRYQQGYTRKYEVFYEYPYIKNRLGMSVNFLYADNRELAFRSMGNKLLFYRAEDERRLYRQYRATFSLHHRTSPLLFQTLKFEYSQSSADTAITSRLNPAFFGNGQTSLRFLMAEYSIKYDKTIFPLYPLGGYRLEGSLRKEGFPGQQVNNAMVIAAAEWHNPIAKNLFLSHRIKTRLQLLPGALPYFLNAAIGYKEDFMTGYQLFVLDGRNFLLQKNTLKYRMLDRNLNLVSYMPAKLRLMNVKLFVRASLDMAYTSDPDHGEGNPYSNRFEYGYGPGLDIILYNNFLFSVEYGITRFGDAGFFYSAGFVF